MTVYEIDPTRDSRWDEFLETHPDASIFHTRGWLEALGQTYGYVPVAFTTSPPECRLANGIPFCAISSWVSGRRLVSLPFSDHCTPLVENPEQLTFLLAYLQTRAALEKWSYIEIRPTDSVAMPSTGFSKDKIFYFHKLDLRPSLDEMFRNFHKHCVQRKIQRAAREDLVYEEGRSHSLLTKFYHLFLMTRRRHGLPAQPVRWFQNLMACLGEKVKIRVVSKHEQPIASILTISYKQSLIYKYGCSDHRFNNLGGTQLLFWRAIQEAKQDSLSEFDMGRSDYDNRGLVAFKDRWGATRTELTYFRYPIKHLPRVTKAGQIFTSQYVWSNPPTSILATAGQALYKHMG